MLNKLILEGHIRCSPRKIQFTDCYEVELSTSTHVRILHDAQKEITGNLTIYIPDFLSPERLLPGDYIYTEARVLPPGSLLQNITVPIFWANVIHQIDKSLHAQYAV